MSDIEIRKYLGKIIDSESFSRSDIYKRLLKYLTESTLKGEKPKEFTVGLEVFNQKADDPATSNVRVYVHKLRKKLDVYYSKEGINDQIYLTIPKGGYTLVFKDRKDISHSRRIKNVWIVILAFVLISFGNLIFIMTQKSDFRILRKTAFWEELISNGKETVVVAGDFFFFSDERMDEKDGRYRNIRDIRINSEEQLREYISGNDSLHLIDYLIPKNTSYMPRDALFSMPYLIPLLERNHIKYQIVLSANFVWESFDQFNIIYIGSFKNMKSLSFLMEKLDVEYDYLSDSLTFTGLAGNSSYSSFFVNPKNIDYALASKMPGPHNNVIMFFASSHDIGSIESVKYFTTLESVRSFEKRTLKDANYFRSIYKAEGFARSGITFDMIEYEPIIDSTLHNFWNQK